MKRVKVVKFPQTEKALMIWFGKVRARSGIVNYALLTQNAMELKDAFGIPKNDLKLSSGWLGKFKARHKFACHNLCGESSDSDAYRIGVSQAKLAAMIATYDVEDVFNFDERCLYYRAPPSKILNVGRPRGVKKKYCIILGLCTKRLREGANEDGIYP